MTLNIHLYAGPGVGKSVTAAKLFVSLKMAGVHCELVTEFAKELQYDGILLQTPQRVILAEQLRRQARLQCKATVVVTDAPVAQNLAYADASELPDLERAIRAQTSRWRAINVVLNRNLDEGYEVAGRYQSLDCAKTFHRDVLVPCVERFHAGDVLHLQVAQASETLHRIVMDALAACATTGGSGQINEAAEPCAELAGP